MQSTTTYCQLKVLYLLILSKKNTKESDDDQVTKETLFPKPQACNESREA